MKNLFYLLFSFGSLFSEITPFKLHEKLDTDPNLFFENRYECPDDSKFFALRENKKEIQEAVTFYFSKPKSSDYPILIFCGGSQNRDLINQFLDKNINLASIIHIHRYFLEEILSLGLGLVTVEQVGVTDKETDIEQFLKFYTRSQRIIDHSVVIEHFLKHPLWAGMEK